MYNNYYNLQNKKLRMETFNSISDKCHVDFSKKGNM